MELSEDRLRNDQQQIKLHGYSALFVYLDYRAIIDQKMKWLMMEMSNALEDEGLNVDNMREINATLLEKYKEFWQLVEPQMRIFYEDLHKYLELPKGIEGKDYTKKDITNIEAELEQMEEELLREQYFLKSLKDIEATLDKEIKLKEESKRACKVMERDTEEFKKREKLHKKVREQVNKNLEGSGDTSYLYKTCTPNRTKLENKIVEWLEKNSEDLMPYEIKDDTG